MFLVKTICLKYRLVFSNKSAMKLFSTKNYIKENLDLFTSFGFTQEMLNEKIESKIHEKRPTELKLTLQILIDSGFKPEDIVSNPEILHYSGWSLDHRIKLAEEGGFLSSRVDLSLIRKFPRLIQKTVIKLKKEGYISEGVNVAMKILSYTDLPNEHYPPRQETGDYKTFDKIQEVAMKSFLKWKLKLNNEEIKNKFQTYPDLKMTSIRLVMKCYDTLVNELKYPEKMVQSSPYLLTIYPPHFYEVLEKLPRIKYKSDMTTASNWELLKIHPSLFLKSIDHLLKILEICKTYGIDLERHYFHPEIMALSTTTVRQRLKAIAKDPILKTLRLVDAFPVLVLRYSEAIMRSEFLREAQAEFHNLNVLVHSKNNFDNVLKNGVGKVYGNDLVNCLANHFKMPPLQVREMLRKNPYSLAVPLMSAWRTLEFLTTEGFSQTQLKSAFTLIMYPKESVEKELRKLDSREDVAHCRDPVTGLIPAELKLQLVLYFLERPYHFTGQGIWAGNPPKDFFTLNDRYLEYLERKKNKASNG